MRIIYGTGHTGFDAGAHDGSAGLVEDGAVPMWEFVSDYHNWWRGPSGGRGASYGRGSLLNSIRDILKAYGNPLYEPNTEIPWAASGVTQAWLDLSSVERCENPVTLKGSTTEYNPEGEYPVITFCEGDHSDDVQSPEIVLARITPETDSTARKHFFLRWISIATGSVIMASQ